MQCPPTIIEANISKMLKSNDRDDRFKNNQYHLNQIFQLNRRWCSQLDNEIL